MIPTESALEEQLQELRQKLVEIRNQKIQLETDLAYVKLLLDRSKNKTDL